MLEGDFSFRDPPKEGLTPYIPVLALTRIDFHLFPLPIHTTLLSHIIGGSKIRIWQRFLCVSPEVLKIHHIKSFKPHIKKVVLF